MILYFLIIINFVAIVTMYFLNETISTLQKENSKLVGIIQNLNNEINFLQKNMVDFDLKFSSPLNENYNSNLILSFLGILTAAVLGLALLTFLKNDTTLMGELSKNSIQATGQYVKDVVVPSVDLLNKGSELRIVANVDNVKKVVTETGAILTTHVTEVNREGILYILNTVKPPVSTKVLGSISRELLSLIP